MNLTLMTSQGFRSYCSSDISDQVELHRHDDILVILPYVTRDYQSQRKPASVYYGNTLSWPVHDSDTADRFRHLTFGKRDAELRDACMKIGRREERARHLSS